MDLRVVMEMEKEKIDVRKSLIEKFEGWMYRWLRDR